MKKPRISKGVPFAMFPKALLEDTNLSSTAVLLYMHLQCYAGDRDTIYPAVSTLARRMRLAKRTVQKAIVTLEAAGWLKRELRIGRTTLYRPNTNPRTCAAIAFRNQRQIGSRKAIRRTMRPNHQALRRVVTPCARGDESGIILPGMKPGSSNKELYQDLPNKKLQQSQSEPVVNTTMAPNDNGHSRRDVPLQLSATWEELFQVASQLMPSLTKMEIHEWLIEMMSKLMDKMPFFKEQTVYQQELVCAALRSIANDLNEISADQDWDPNEVRKRIIQWIEAYRLGE